MNTTSNKMRWAGRVVTAVPVLFLIFDSVIKLMNIQPVQDSFRQLGYPLSIAVGIGALELALLALYLIPRTAIFGAILWTGYLGGAVATHVRVESPLFSHILFPLYVGLLLWLGLFLRDIRVRALIQETA